jgi:hypothetical protein
VKVFQVGDKVTVCYYSDRHASYVTRVEGKTVTVQRASATLLNDPGSGEEDALTVTNGRTEGEQRYDVRPDPEGEESRFSLRSDGKWVMVGELTRCGTQLLPGHSEYFDYDF